MTTPVTVTPEKSAELRTVLHRRLPTWFAANARDIAWRTPETSAWGVLLSEVMSQQTQVSRVEPIWLEWINRWPTPTDFAAARIDEVLRAWGRLGYPRRALRLHECAQQIVTHHNGVVPEDVAELLALPGIGDYTARAVAAFAYGQRVPVVDTNVRRVLARFYHGEYEPRSPSKRELAVMESLLPDADGGVDAAKFSTAIMELGALICTTTPKCGDCPLRSSCLWVAGGSIVTPRRPSRRVQKFAGTDRQVRGLIMAELRAADGIVPLERIEAVWADGTQRNRALASLLDDGLAQEVAGGFRLPN